MKLTSLVVCPPTLTGHWVEEIRKFCDDLDPLQYAGNPQERARCYAQQSVTNLTLNVWLMIDMTLIKKYRVMIRILL